MSLALFIIPDVKSDSFSGLLAKRKLEDKDEVSVKTYLMRFLGEENGSTASWDPVASMDPRVRSSLVKYLFALFGSRFHHEYESAMKRIDVAIMLIICHARLPSEIKEGLCFMKDLVDKFPLPQQASGAGDGGIRLLLARGLVDLVENLEVFEISRAEVGYEKAEALRAMGCLLFMNPVVPECAEGIVLCIKMIFPDKNGVEVVDLMRKQDKDRRLQLALDFNRAKNLGIKGEVPTEKAGKEKKTIFRYLGDKWFDVKLIGEEPKFKTGSDWVCVVELLGHYLNTAIVEEPDKA